MKIKQGNVQAKSLASQSYLYRLGYVWLNVLMIKDKRNTSLNPFKMSFVDVIWIAYFSLATSFLVIATLILGWFKAYSMKDVTPVVFDWGGRDGAESSVDYSHRGVWYYDNGKIK